MKKEENDSNDDVASCSVKTTSNIRYIELRTWKDFNSMPATRTISNREISNR